MMDEQLQWSQARATFDNSTPASMAYTNAHFVNNVADRRCAAAQRVDKLQRGAKYGPRELRWEWPFSFVPGEEHACIISTRARVCVCRTHLISTAGNKNNQIYCEHKRNTHTHNWKRITRFVFERSAKSTCIHWNCIEAIRLLCRSHIEQPPASPAVERARRKPPTI